MSKNKKDCPYEQMEGKLDTIDKKLMEVNADLEDLTKRLIEEPEVCPDVVDSEKALQDALDRYFISDMLKNKKPIGDA